MQSSPRAKSKVARPAGIVASAGAAIRYRPRRTPAAFSVHFTCQRCTNCCRWPGLVKVGAAEIGVIAGYFGLSQDAFIQRYTRVRPERDGLALIDKGPGATGGTYNHGCIFLDGRDCAIQPVKPMQCAGFPNIWNFPA